MVMPFGLPAAVTGRQDRRSLLVATPSAIASSAPASRQSVDEGRGARQPDLGVLGINHQDRWALARMARSMASSARFSVPAGKRQHRAARGVRQPVIRQAIGVAVDRPAARSWRFLVN
jgi:hypothetical protein